MKPKPDSTRTYDADGYKRRAACICVSDDRPRHVLLVNSTKRPERWIVPGGCVEPGERSEAAAVREAGEEAGVLGEVRGYVGSFAVPHVERKHRTEVYVLAVRRELATWDESISMGRQRRWFSVEEALRQLRQHTPHQTAYLETMLECR